MRYTIENEFIRLTIDSLGAEMVSAIDRATGSEMIWCADPAVWNRHAPILFPYAGKLTGGHFKATDGKLYELPASFMVQTAFGLSKVVDGYDVWNVAAVQDAMTKLQEDAYVFNYYTTQLSVMSTCISNNLSAFVNWQTGECSFDSEGFIALLNFVKSFPAEFDREAYDSEHSGEYVDDATMMKNGQKLLSSAYLYSFEDYLYSMSQYAGEGITFVGYPSESGEPGNSFYIQCPMAISSVTKYPDAAWDFVSTMIRQTNEDAESMYAFPISQEAFDKKMTSVMTEQYQLDVNGEQVDWDEDGEPDKMCIGTYEVVENGESTWQQVYALTQEDIDQILSVINSATGIVDYDDEILSIVSDEVSAYFAGDKDVQTTANMIQSRVNLYVQEQR